MCMIWWWWTAAWIRCQRALLFPSSGPQSVQADRCQLPEGPSRVRHRSHVQSGRTPGSYQRRCHRCHGGLQRASIERDERGWQNETHQKRRRRWRRRAPFSLIEDQYLFPHVIRIWCGVGACGPSLYNHPWATELQGTCMRQRWRLFNF